MKHLSPFPFFRLIMLAAAWPAHGEPLQTSDLVAQALARNPELRFYEAEIAVARGARRTAGQFANPDLGLELGHKKINEIGGGIEGAGEVWKAQIMQTFDFPSRIALRKAIADRDITLAELGLAQYRAQLSNEVRARAGDVTLLRRKATAAREVRLRFEELVAVLVQRDTGSISAKLERRIMEASLLTSDRALTDAANDASEATTTLSVLCGRAPDAVLELEGTVASFPPAPSLPALKQAAAVTNFELQQKRLELARQGLKIDLSKSERWGKISFGPYLSGERTYETTKEGGVILAVPLPLWNRNQGNISAEKARLAQAEALLAASLRDLERDLVTERTAYAAELEALARWKPETEQEFQAAAGEADHHYRLGAVAATTYVEMQRQYLEAMTALIETRRNAWKHLTRLERLTGVPLQ